MTSPSAEYGDQEWNRAVDSSVILMSLMITRLLIKRFKAPRKVKDQVIARLDTLIARYQTPQS